MMNLNLLDLKLYRKKHNTITQNSILNTVAVLREDQFSAQTLVVCGQDNAHKSETVCRSEHYQN